MLVELRVHKELYIGMLGGQQHYTQVETALNYFETYSFSKKYWMQFPEMGCLFATAFNCAFNCVLCILSPQQYITYLPLRLGPANEIKIVQMVLYDNNHFMNFFWKQGAPIPHIVPGWQYHRYKEAAVWEDVVSELIDGWDDLVGCPLKAHPSIQSCLSELKPYYFYSTIFI